MALFVRSLRAAVNAGVRIGQQSWPQPLVLGLQKQIANYSFSSHPTTTLTANKVTYGQNSPYPSAWFGFKCKWILASPNPLFFQKNVHYRQNFFFCIGA